MKIFATAALIGLFATASAFSPVAKTAGESLSKLASTTQVFDDVSVEAPVTVPAQSPLVPTSLTTGSMMSSSSEQSDQSYFGERSVFRENTYTFVNAEELALTKQRIPNPSAFAERQTRPISLNEIRNQQIQHGLHTTSNYDTTRNCLRN